MTGHWQKGKNGCLRVDGYELPVGQPCGSCDECCIECRERCAEPHTVDYCANHTDWDQPGLREAQGRDPGPDVVVAVHFGGPVGPTACGAPKWSAKSRCSLWRHVDCHACLARKEPRPPDPPDQERGLYQRYRVVRVDGRDAPGQKHANCHLFVLDLTHDPHAREALRRYVSSCCEDYPQLAQDLARLLPVHATGERNPPTTLDVAPLPGLHQAATGPVSKGCVE